MRTTPLPLLSQLPRGFTIERCRICLELAFADEICRSEQEAVACPPRAEVDSRQAALRSSRSLRLTCDPRHHGTTIPDREPGPSWGGYNVFLEFTEPCRVIDVNGVSGARRYGGHKEGGYGSERQQNRYTFSVYFLPWRERHLCVHGGPHGSSSTANISSGSLGLGPTGDARARQRRCKAGLDQDNAGRN